MKKYLLFIVMAFCAAPPLLAQTEDDQDLPLTMEDGRYKEFGGFLLDMSPVMMTPPPIPLSLNYFQPYGMEDAQPYLLNPDAVRLSPKLTFTSPSLPSLSSLLYPGASHLSMQGASFRLNNGVRINTYGEYDADGYKRYNPAALPWERNNFNAAFEVKSPNGKFGVRVEMHHGRNNPY